MHKIALLALTLAACGGSTVAVDDAALDNAPRDAGEEDAAKFCWFPGVPIDAAADGDASAGWICPPADE